MEGYPAFGSCFPVSPAGGHGTLTSRPRSSTTSSNATASIMKDIHEARIEGPQKLMEATGWHYRQSFGPEVTARAAMHEPGSKTILGKTYQGNGFNEVKAVMRDPVSKSRPKGRNHMEESIKPDDFLFELRANAPVQRRREALRCNRLLAVECAAHLRNPLPLLLSLGVSRNDVTDWLLAGGNP